MMALSARQAHVLQNLDRVVPLASRSAFLRYQLDGRECTTQITGLAVRKLISKYSDGRLRRLAAVDPDRKALRDTRVGKRQPVPAEAIDFVQSLFLDNVRRHVAKPVAAPLSPNSAKRL